MGSKLYNLKKIFNKIVNAKDLPDAKMFRKVKKNIKKYDKIQNK